ncbi:undecaprenyldiphospho-muramoylpentapeptide beta-N-acetylglucosaminyltransferase [Mahella australiensis]|uniref:UDP-N-acetylglucosamine--N-acetylmuramyl-(pentapeptide) pyrophosphoryl-undecaprenol N-acetylglucosamine transferase n=1 Tax=Mahella australiensis (strain DSM 15567 / CIP 107919 / 50-1 BON) TaxID=697281 RepID=F3ZZ19_MAHA5|nr:undecaprenyldiphospho-muramoylpentapeptide beta-N-acetylglucosaminyltransferase [Mahella australiensis]AEE96778.1 UDP-N-acetylglucosamine--N-acetylmuramyl-(pentapeptide) pyrophosphoryl-undecaprenol N-acetylglucosamine transferase [Mahella australiensis 50-1 BON]
MRVLIAGGGTGGHIYPAIAIAKAIIRHKPETEILFIGTKKGLESQLVPKEGFKLETITVSGFNRKLSFGIFKTLADLQRGLKESRGIIDRFEPDVVVGTGGYVCGPVLFIASLKHIPTIIHEQNVMPGATNRILSHFVDKIAISFDQSAQYFNVPTGKVEITGNPVRREIIDAKPQPSRKSLGFSADKPVIAIIGGSRGAERINQMAVGLIDWVIKRRKPYQVLLSTGNAQYEAVLNGIKSKNIDLAANRHIKVLPYIYDMGEALAAADLVVSRAGAIALAEITARGLPSILIPSPNVVNNHQEYNARMLEKEGAALVMLEQDVTPEAFIRTVGQLLEDKERLKNMADNSRALGITDADERIYDMVNRLVSSKHLP